MTTESEFVTAKNICESLKITRGTFWSWRRKGLFTPEPYPINSRKVLYRKADVDQWLAERQAS